MKVYIGPYRNRWVSYIHDRHMNKKYGYGEWDESLTLYESFLEKLEDSLQWIYNHSINLYLDRTERKEKIRIDRYDTWSMDSTLSLIILPMLKQIRDSKHGAPYVEPDDVPKDLRPKEQDEYGTDDTHFARWAWVLDEMIWAFEQKTRDDWESDYYGPYIDGEDGKPFSGHFEWIDDKGREAHQKRMSKGFELFGKYYEGLWD